MNKDLNGDSLYGAYVRRQLPVGESVELSGAVGYRAVESNSNGADLESDVSYGIGTGFRITDDVSVSVDYMQYVEESDYEHTEINLGVKGRF
ncbi:MAG: porin family protein [Gammaproteobacteria bacterium]|nr:porin family protein [Gammaproteobacteria bacterium]